MTLCVIWRAVRDFQHGINQSISFHTIGKIVWLLISLTNVRQKRDKLSSCPMNYLFQQLSLRYFQSKSNAICGMMSLCLEGPSNQYAAVTLEVKTLRLLVISRNDFLIVTLGNLLNHHFRFLLCKNTHFFRRLGWFWPHQLITYSWRLCWLQWCNGSGVSQMEGTWSHNL